MSLLCRTRLLRSLPFEPMALTKFDAMVKLSGELQQQASVSDDATHETGAIGTMLSKRPGTLSHLASSRGKPARGKLKSRLPPHALNPPFFISPKHDGVRLVSYVTNLAAGDSRGGGPLFTSNASTSSTKHGTKAQQSKGEKRGAGSGTSKDTNADSVNASLTTCYSRYGRQIHGLFWVEREMRLLRELSGDPRLVLDGELYIHNADGDTVTTPPADNENSRRKPHKGTPFKPHKSKSAVQASQESVATLQSGFLGVTALVHRLRGTKSSILSVEDVLQYVSSLPRYCVFDVVSYQPSSIFADDVNEKGAEDLSGSARHTSRARSAHDGLYNEWCRLRTQLVEDVMQTCCVADLEMLRVVPNITPFSQRLRTLVFLFTLLERATADPSLINLFETVHAPLFAEQTPAAAGSAPSLQTPASSARKSEKGAASRKDTIRYIGGAHVNLIPYHIAHSLEEVQNDFLPRYLQLNYEGAVVRSPLNVYEFHEKKKGALQQLLEPLTATASLLQSLDLLSSHPVSQREHGPLPHSFEAQLIGNSHGSARNDAAVWYLPDHPAGGKGKKQLPMEENHRDREAEDDIGDLWEELAAIQDDERVAKESMLASKQLSPRSLLAAKLLPHEDQEFPILRALFRNPVANATASVLVNKKTVGTKARNALFVKTTTFQRDSSGPTERKSAPHPETMEFYGLQCMTPSGRIFNVNVPKMPEEKKEHLLSLLLRSRPVVSSSNGGQKKGANRPSSSAQRSLAGLYATVQYQSLTPYGVPRFGSVKAIRGGKGWFL